MEKLTFERICEIIREYNLYQYLFEENSYYLEDVENDTYQGEELLNSLNFKNFKQVDYVCNTDEMFCVIYFEDSDIYIKLTGTYDSYGHDYHRKIKQVFPKQITKTIYE